ncbi:hypothetical protein B0H34DRAFT_383221 [Crassisporium funariophilum]|nr:hypothetical protein B0H34DRAFT_383221 [Crassisporium funariophilum]
MDIANPNDTPDTRPVYLIVYNSPIFPAHWAMWIPKLANENMGKLLQVEGDPATGFEYDFQENYDLQVIIRSHELVKLADVDKKFAVDFLEGRDEEDGTDPVGAIRSMAMDEMTKVARRIPPPLPSLKSAGMASTPGKVEIKNCQTWMTQFVEELILANIFPEGARQVLAIAPKN